MTGTHTPSAMHDAHPFSPYQQPTTPQQPHGSGTAPPELSEQRVPTEGPDTKGKTATKPVPIRPPTILRDLFDVAGSSSSGQGISPTTLGSNHISPMFPYASFDGPDFTTVDPALVQDLYDNSQVPFSSSSASPKGKEKDIPPSLPPLSFSDMSINYDQTPWASLGSISSMPYSYGLTPSPPQDTVTSISPEETHITRSFNSATSAESTCADASTSHIPSRRRSLSNLKHTPPLASLTMSKIKVKLGPSTTTQSNLARKLLYGKWGDTAPNSAASSETTLLTVVRDAPAPILPTLDPSVAPWYAAPLQYDLDNVVPPTFVRPRAGTEPSPKLRSSRMTLKAKGRSKSSPLPFSALDYVPTTPADIFRPIPLFRRNYIDQILPKELQIHIFKCFIHLFEEDHLRMVTEGRWTISKAISSRHQFVGKNRGIRELFKLARVSRSWQNLVFDGQLWTDLDLHSFPGLPKSTVLRATHIAGPFVRRLNLSGHKHLQAATLTDIANHLCLRDMLSYTHLTAINLEGCSALTTRSLHHLLVRSRFLRALRLKGLAAVTNTTCELLATFCTQLEQLNLSRCPNMDAEGIRCLAQTTLAQRECLRLKELRVSGLKHMDDATMQVLGKAAPRLEVLDLSYVRRLHNSALEAFFAVDDSFDYTSSGVELIRLNSRQIGRDTSNDTAQFYNRRVTKLRHISISFCILLTDTACSNIAYAVPQLEFLEIAGIGADLKDDGLVRLLETTPHIRRIDLEDATDISDSVLSCLTPVAEISAPPTSSMAARREEEGPPQPGHALEWLSVSHAGNLTDDAFLALIRACPKLRVLEADNTRMSGSTLKEFVDVNRQRRALDAKVVAIDCRNVVEGVVKDLSASGVSRPRLGVRAFWARRLGYTDGKDEACEEDLKVGQDECDPKKVVVKTFYSWQTVDAVKSARDKRRKATSRRAGSFDPDVSGDFFDMDFEAGSGRRGAGAGLTRWWSPNGRSGGGRNSPPIIPDLSNDGCILM